MRPCVRSFSRARIHFGHRNVSFKMSVFEFEHSTPKVQVDESNMSYNKRRKQSTVAAEDRAIMILDEKDSELIQSIKTPSIGDNIFDVNVLKIINDYTDNELRMRCPHYFLKWFPSEIDKELLQRSVIPVTQTQSLQICIDFRDMCHRLLGENNINLPFLRGAFRTTFEKCKQLLHGFKIQDKFLKLYYGTEDCIHDKRTWTYFHKMDFLHTRSDDREYYWTSLYLRSYFKTLDREWLINIPENVLYTIKYRGVEAFNDFVERVYCPDYRLSETMVQNSPSLMDFFKLTDENHIVIDTEPRALTPIYQACLIRLIPLLRTVITSLKSIPSEEDQKETIEVFHRHVINALRYIQCQCSIMWEGNRSESFVQLLNFVQEIDPTQECFGKCEKCGEIRPRECLKKLFKRQVNSTDNP